MCAASLGVSWKIKGKKKGGGKGDAEGLGKGCAWLRCGK